MLIATINQTNKEGKIDWVGGATCSACRDPEANERALHTVKMVNLFVFVVVFSGCAFYTTFRVRSLRID
jgi:hypothetical protein